jgi:putative ABC transport system substrate-binding protein
MRRREFTIGAGNAAAAWPVVARAQQRTVPVIGWLDSKAAAPAVAQVTAFRQGLAEAGFVEGRNVAIEFRWADDQLDRLPAMAADLVRRRVAVIVTTNASTPAAIAATSTIPIVFSSGADPVETGLVRSLNRPGGNVTGVSMLVDTLNPKRLELLHELVPKPSLIGLLWFTGARNLQAQLQEIRASAGALGRNVLIVQAEAESDFDAAFTQLVQAGAGALFVGTSAFFLNQRRRLIALAARHALPASFHFREFVENGGLMSYGANINDAQRRIGHYVGRILKGEKPGDLPVELPTRYELVFNLATAKALKLDIPAKLLALADEVIE